MNSNDINANSIVFPNNHHSRSLLFRYGRIDRALSGRWNEWPLQHEFLAKKGGMVGCSTCSLALDQRLNREREFVTIYKHPLGFRKLL